MNNILIVGGAGYIGSHTAKCFLQNSCKVTVFDNLHSGYLDCVDALRSYGDVSYVKGDLRNKEEIYEVINSEKFDAVIHFAALLSVSDSMEKPGEYFENNFYGTLNLLEGMRKNQVDKLVFSSTCATYGESQYLPIDEAHPQNPTNPYGESKLLVERMLRWYERLYGINYVALRYFNVCGASEDGLIGDSKKPSVHLVQNIVRGALGIEPFYLTYQEVDTKDGSPIRDYVDVNDLSEAHYLSFNYLYNGGASEIFNLGNGAGYSVLEIVEEVEHITKKQISRKEGTRRVGEYASVYADIKKAQKLLGWQPKTPLSESVNNLIKWYKNHPEGFTK